MGASSNSLRWSSQESRARLGRWLLAVTTLVSALGLGALHTPMLALCAVLAVIGTSLVWFDADPLEPRPAATILVAVAVGLTLWTCLQIIPLPRGLLGSIAHETADVWSRALSPLREDGPSSATISLDPAASRVQILRGITYLVVFVGALRVARRPEGVRFLERTLIVSAVAIAGAALVHPALGARKVFGLYEPGETLGYDPHHLAPLLNTNHLAAYVNIGLMLAFTSAIEKREPLPRPLALVIVLLLGATTVWTLSRGGTGAMILGAILATVLAFAARRSQRVVVPLAAVVAALTGGAILLLAAFDGTRDKFLRNDVSKVGVARSALRLLDDFGALGVGRGAFESAFPKVRDGTEYYVFTHPENIVVQWTTEWGVPVAVVAFLAIAWALRPQTVLARSRPPAGAWAALVATGVHNLVDFNSEVPGVVIALTLCAAMVTGGRGGGASVSHRGGNWSRRPNALAIGLAAVTVIGLVATVPFTKGELYNEQRSFRDLGLDRSVTRDVFHERAREAMLRHPAEAYFPFVGAVRATVVRDESVLPWAARALERSPVYGRVHLLLARSLFVKNPSQARLEYRIACIQDGQLCSMNESLRLVGGYEDAMELVPDGPRGVAALVHLGNQLYARLPSTVLRLDRELSARDPSALDPVRRAAAASLDDVRNEETWCFDPTASKGAHPACVADGLAAARRLRAASPTACEGHALTAELRVAAGEVDAGLSELEHALDGITERSACGRRLVTLAQQTKNNLRVDAALDRLLKLGCEAPADCVTNLEFAAAVETSRGSPRRALALMKKAAERSPENDTLLADVAARAEAQGLHGEALEAYTKLADRHPGDPRWTAAVARERLAATRGAYDRH